MTKNVIYLDSYQPPPAPPKKDRKVETVVNRVILHIMGLGIRACLIVLAVVIILALCGLGR